MYTKFILSRMGEATTLLYIELIYLEYMEKVLV